MQYTITKQEVARLATARTVQAMRAEKSGRGGAPTVRDVAPIEWRNGRVDTRAVRIGLLSKWVNLLPEAWGDRIAVELNAGEIRFRCGTAEIKLCDVRPEGARTADTPKELAEWFGAPMVLEANDGRFALKTEVGDLASVKAEIKALRTERARSADIDLFRRLRGDMMRQRAAVEKLEAKLEAARLDTAGPIGPALEQSRTLRGVKRLARRYTRELRAFYAGTSNFPLFSPWTPPAGFAAPMADDEKALARLYELNAKDEAAGQLRKSWARDTRIQNLKRKIVAAYVAALAKSLAVEGCLHLYGTSPGETKRHRQREISLSVYEKWSGPRAELLQARQAVRTLPGEITQAKNELEMNEFRAAKLEQKLVKSGFMVVAVATRPDGSSKGPVRLPVSELPGQLEKARAAGAVVDIVESCNDEFPVGRLS